MTINTMIDQAMQEFKQNLTRFCADVAELPLTVESAHAITQAIQSALAETGKRAFQVYLESKEEQRDIVTNQGEAFRFKYKSGREFQTLWGVISVGRRVYQNASDSKTFVPLDYAWGMENHFMTIEVREAVAFSCAHVTPEETSELLKKSALFHPHPTQIKRCLEGIAAWVGEEQPALDGRIRAQENVPERARVLVASMDGANVLLNEPEQVNAKRGRSTTRPATADSQAASTSYRNAMVGTVSFYGAVPEGSKTPERLACRYISHMPEENAVTFKKKFEAELADAERMAPPDIIKVLLCDGARALWKYADNCARFYGYLKLIDYYHTLEHLSLAAEALFGENAEKAQAWYVKYGRKLLEEDLGAHSVLRSMEYYKNKGGLPKNRANALVIQQTFFQRNQGMMTYADFRRRGLPIGSGPVEAACKTIVKTRLCRSGMRWSRKGGQRILDLRTYVKSNRWDAFWNEYKTLLYAA